MMVIWARSQAISSLTIDATNCMFGNAMFYSCNCNIKHFIKKSKIAIQMALTIPICPLVSYNQVNMN